MLDELTKIEKKAICRLAKAVGKTSMLLIYGSRLLRKNVKDIDVIFVCNSEIDTDNINKENMDILSSLNINIHPFIITERVLFYKLYMGDPQILTFLKYGDIFKNNLLSKKFIKSGIDNIIPSQDRLASLTKEIYVRLSEIDVNFNYKDYFFILISICQLICSHNKIISKFPNFGLFSQATELCKEQKISDLIIEASKDYKVNKVSKDYSLALIKEIIANYTNIYSKVIL